MICILDVSENFRNMRLKIYELEPAKFIFSLGWAWQAALKKTKVKLDLLTDIDVLIMVEKFIREGICQSIYQYTKINKKYLKDYDKNKESLNLQYWDVNNSYDWVMPQELPVNNFKWIKDTSQFNENVIRNYNEESDEGYFLKVDVQYLEKLHELHNDLPFLPERMKIEKVEILAVKLHEKTEYFTNMKI